MVTTFRHPDPMEMLTYTMDSPDWLEGDTIVETTWTVLDGTITLGDHENLGQATCVRAGKGVAGEVVTLLNRIVSRRGQKEVRMFQLLMGTATLAGADT